MNNHFHERQRFNQWWLWMIIIIYNSNAVLSIFWVSTHSLELGGYNFYLLWLPILIGLLVIAFFLVLELRTKINDEGVEVHYYPFAKKKFLWEDIDSAKVINYGFVGGWGYRHSSKYGTVWNVKGNMGLALNLRSGKKFTIGTQKEEELIQALNNFQPSDAEMQLQTY